MTIIARALGLGSLLVFAPVAARAEPDPARRAEAKKAIAALKGGDIEPAHRGRMAAMSLAESAPLSEGLVNVLKALSSIDPSMCGTLVVAGLSEAADPTVKQRCGRGVEALRAAVERGAEKGRTKALMATCKIKKAPERDPARLNAWALLLSVVLKDVLAADQKSSPEEQALADLVAYVCPVGVAPPR